MSKARLEEVTQALYEAASGALSDIGKVRLQRAAMVFAWEQMTAIKWLDGGATARAFKAVKHVYDSIVEVTDVMIARREKQ